MERIGLGFDGEAVWYGDSIFLEGDGHPFVGEAVWYGDSIFLEGDGSYFIFWGVFAMHATGTLALQAFRCFAATSSGCMGVPPIL